jgi:hypothetical protein
MKIPVGTVGMMAAKLLASTDAETFLDIYDRGGYIVAGVSLRTMALRKIAKTAVELAHEVERQMDLENTL